MSGRGARLFDRFEGYVTRLYYSLNEENFDCLAVISRYYNFRDHRKVLFGINLFMTVVSVILTGYTVYLAYLFYDVEQATVWIAWVGFGAIFLLFASFCIVGMRGAHLVSLDHLLAYFWCMVIFIAPFVLGVIACIDFYEYIDVWFKHQWEMDNFANMRQLFCEVYTDEDPDAIDKCSSPLTGGNDWCLAKYNTTDCSYFRDKSIDEAVDYCRNLSLVQAIIFGTFAGLCSIAVALCHRIITDEVLTKSMNEFINVLLLIPVATCAGLAFYLWWLNDYTAKELEYFWLANSFMGVAIAQVVALPLGFFAGRLKSKWMLQLYIFLMLCILTTMVLNGALCIIFAGILAEVFVPTTKEFGDIACDKNLVGCCCCDYTTEVDTRCPEWEDEEIMSLLVLDMKISGIAALGSALYPVGALIIAVMTRAALANYKLDYVGVGKTLTEDEKLEEQGGQVGVQGIISRGPRNSRAIQQPEGRRGGSGAGFVPSLPDSVDEVDGSLEGSSPGASPISGVSESVKEVAGGNGMGVLEKAGFMSLFGTAGGVSDKNEVDDGVDDPPPTTSSGLKKFVVIRNRAGSGDSLYSAQDGCPGPDDETTGATELRTHRVADDDDTSALSMKASSWGATVGHYRDPDVGRESD